MRNSSEVTTTSGPIRGETFGAVSIFRGVRYGAPPVGGLRFKPPVRPEPWSETADCTRFGAIAPQPTTPVHVAGTTPDQSEDCLFLNVFTPACDDARRPVLFWLHGGSFVLGAGSSEGYDGSRFALNHDLVVVSINYRLGALGFCQLTVLGDEYELSGNAGLLDQVLALQWVRDNITAFGGDPENVTIFGESAGAGSAAALMAARPATDLFHKVIAQSGSHALVRQIAGATEVTGRICGELTCTPLDLLKMPVQQLLAGQQAVRTGWRMSDGRLFGPVVDDVVLPEPLESISSGWSGSMPAIIGTNLDEATLFSLLDASANDLDRAALVDRMTPYLGDRTMPAIGTYLARRPGATDDEIWSAVMSDMIYRVPAVHMAEMHSKRAPTFVYLFSWKTPVMGGRLGACHGLEIPFVFNLVDRESMLLPSMTPEMTELSLRMHGAWASFARTGDPNNPDLAEWPAYGPDRPTMVFDRRPMVELNPHGEELSVWG